ncbi:MAG: PIN domain-containing protein [Magnetococcales bacterium]|nr:PIN domain-containing protein [Magnetococcales bacterium]
MKILTYVDANVLIAAFAAKYQIREISMAVLRDPDRNLLVSDALWLEIMPKAMFYKRSREIEFYEQYISLAVRWIPWNTTVVAMAKNLASRYGLSAMDAIHVASAIVGGADELVTGEKFTKPMLKIKELRVISLNFRDQAS